MNFEDQVRVDQERASDSKIEVEYLAAAHLLAEWLSVHDPLKRDADTLFAAALTQARDVKPLTQNGESHVQER